MDTQKYLKILRDKYTVIANDDSVQGTAKTNAIDMVAFINRALREDALFNLPAPEAKKLCPHNNFKLCQEELCQIWWKCQEPPAPPFIASSEGKGY